MQILLEEYAGPYLHSGDFTLERRASAIALLGCANAVIAMATADGVPFTANPATGTQVAGEGHGGFRDQACTIGAPHSSHKEAHAVDVYDPKRLFAAWCVLSVERLKAAGIRAVEDPRWTPTWVHLDVIPRMSGKFFFIPDATLPRVPALPGQPV